VLCHPFKTSVDSCALCARLKLNKLGNRSNKNTQLDDATINRKIYCFVVQALLNMFRALLCPSSGARQTAVAASGFRMNVEAEVFSAVVGLLANRPRQSNKFYD